MIMKSKIIALGDSIIKGVVLNIEENGKLHYALCDHTIADEVAQHTHQEVVNLGKIGCTIEAGERILDCHIESIENAKYALLCFGNNDCDYHWRAIATNPKGEHHPKTPISVFEKAYARIIDKLRKAGVTPIIMTMPTIDAARYCQFVSSVLSEEEKRNLNKWLKTGAEAIWAGHELYNDAIKRVAAAVDAKLVDVSSIWKNTSKCLCVDGVHPNAEGQKTIGEAIVSSLQHS
jgi:lysophospholipase L1-like esterase